jgi:hypothetical protein
MAASPVAHLEARASEAEQRLDAIEAKLAGVQCILDAYVARWRLTAVPAAAGRESADWYFFHHKRSYHIGLSALYRAIMICLCVLYGCSGWGWRQPAAAAPPDTAGHQADSSGGEAGADRGAELLKSS